MSSVFHGMISVSIFGQSHSGAIGVTIDGLPAGEKVDMDELSAFLRRRAPGRNVWSTARSEADSPEFLSGLVDDVTCGTPLTAVIRNTNARSSDYAELRDTPRPGHADYTAHVKYGSFQDVAGGGHFSGRLTAPLCVAGGIALQILAQRGIRIGAHLYSVESIFDDKYDAIGLTEKELSEAPNKEFPVLNDNAGRAMRERIEAARAEGDSVGGVIECAAIGVPAGIGDPMFDGMENRISHLAFSIPAVKAIEFGAGFEAARSRGSANNDEFFYEDGVVRTRTNNCGGILGGITDGMPIVFRVAVKPTPSIALPQKSVSLSRHEDTRLEIKGRHDPCIAPRAVPCVEAAAAIAILDAMIKDRRL